MNRDDIVKLAQEAAIMPPDWGATENQWRSLEAFAKLVAEHEREACAREAETLWQQYQDTKDAHERASPEPFMPGRFGFDQSTVQQSQRIAAAIRARGQG